MNPAVIIGEALQAYTNVFSFKVSPLRGFESRVIVFFYQGVASTGY
jgi:hypothetical protein